MENLFRGRRLEIDANEVFRAMGYPSPERVSEPVREICLAQLGRLDRFLQPWAASHEVRIEAVEYYVVRLDSGRTLGSRRLANILRRATAVQICVATVGSEVMLEIERLVAAGSMVEALALDAAATAAVKALMTSAREQVCADAEQRHCGTTLQYGPGYTGWQFEDTAVLFSYFDAESLPVRLNEQFMMLPQKSLLSVIGLVPGGRAAPEVLSCRMCDLEHCSVRQVPAAKTRSPAAPGERNATGEVE